MTYTIGKLGPRGFFESGFEVSIYLDLGAKQNLTQRPPYDIHILEGLLMMFTGTRVRPLSILPLG